MSKIHDNEEAEKRGGRRRPNLTGGQRGKADLVEARRRRLLSALAQLSLSPPPRPCLALVPFVASPILNTVSNVVREATPAPVAASARRTFQRLRSPVQVARPNRCAGRVLERRRGRYLRIYLIGGRLFMFISVHLDCRRVRTVLFVWKRWMCQTSTSSHAPAGTRYVIFLMAFHPRF